MSVDPAPVDRPSSRQRRVDRLFDEYADSHQNVLNVVIHWVAVPVIYWSVLAFLYALPFPASWRLVPGLSWGLLGGVLASLYAATLSIALAAGMAGFSLLCLLLASAFARWGDVPLWQLALFVFGIAWVFQFIGHKIEGRKPSFFRDLQFLLVGPAWLLAKVYRAFGLRY